MSTLLAVTRPTEWNFPLFVHVFGAMILVGGLLAGASSMAFARGDTRFLRLGYWTLLLVALPGYIVMRVGAEWLYTKEGWDDLPDDQVPAWLDIGYIVADAGAVLTLIALIVGGIGVRRLRNDKGQGLLKAAMIISLLVLAAAVVAIWAMSGKPD
jgi:ABC-type maltose transport system permease subunit